MLLFIAFAAIFVAVIAGAFNPPRQTSAGAPPSVNIETEGNFFTRPVVTTPTEINDRRPELLSAGYEKAAENDALELYLLKSTIGVAVYDKNSGYTWQSDYPRLSELPNPPTGVVAARIMSGVTIEYFDANASAVTSATLSFTEDSGKAKAFFKAIENGFRTEIDFTAVGIKFALEVTLSGEGLRARVPADSIEEYEVERLRRTLRYHLKSIMLFPYFGSANYEINGYALIPDGSGALIRYTDAPSATAYVKRVYGPDYGFAQAAASTPHLKDAPVAALPVYGVAHGYNQAAFLARIESGAGAAEIHSYPYLYNNIPINTTFFKLITRDTFRIEISSGEVITLLNDDPYPNDYALAYDFLRGDKANYVGMAESYRESLGLKRASVLRADVPLRLQILGLDYKRGLFGKNYRTMTTFAEALDIVKALEAEGVGNFQITYLGWNNGGYYNYGSSARKLDRRLGDLEPLTRYLRAKRYGYDFTINPLLHDRYGFGAKTVKKINLAPFSRAEEGALVGTTYYLSPGELAPYIKEKNEYFGKKHINGFHIANLADAFSYRYKNSVVYREDMIKEIAAGLKEIEDYAVSATRANDYLLPYIKNYYGAPLQASGFIYETDSVPFLSILLSGYVFLYSPEVNFVSDYRLAALRMIEYNLYPSFTVTSAPAHRLRYTNFEHLLSTEYGLWEEIIVATYATVNGALGRVYGQKIVGHYYPAPGVACVTYEDGTKIYVNYGAADYQSGDGVVKAESFLVKGGDEQ